MNEHKRSMSEVRDDNGLESNPALRRFECDQLARALAALLAAWWMHYGRNHDMTMDKARAPPLNDKAENSTRHHNAANTAAKRR
jgi:hypothetical protein